MPSSPITRGQIVRLVLTLVAFLAVMIFSPRMEGPRIMCGHEFRAKGGGPGLTDTGLLLLVLAPLVVYLLVGWIQRWSSGRDDGSDRTPR